MSSERHLKRARARRLSALRKAAMRQGFAPVNNAANIIRERLALDLEKRKAEFVARGGSVSKTDSGEMPHTITARPRHNRDRLDETLLEKFASHRKKPSRS